MWVITIHAIPNTKENPDAAKEFGGSYVNCWINFLLEDGAVELSKFYIRQNGWIPLEITEDNLWFNQDDCETTEEKQYFSEADEYGACLIWHSYPFESEETDEDFELESFTTNNQRIKRTKH